MSQSKNKYAHIAKAERNEIKILLEKGYSYSDIGKALGRDKSSISREIKGNSVKGEYDPEKAEQKAYTRRRNASFRGRKIAVDIPLRKYVEDKLERGWSPEAIAGRIKNWKPSLENVSKDTIYRYLKSPYGAKLRRKGRKNGKKKDGRKTKLKNRTFIEERPEEAWLRESFGHWEMDFVESGKSSKAALLVILDRKSRYAEARLVKSKKTSLVARTAKEMFEKHISKTVTTDNDLAFQKHEELSEMIATPVFFCHPYSSSEKGSVEEVNRRIRRYFPKGTDFSRVFQTEVNKAIRNINDYPRKCLNYAKPSEIMNEESGPFLSKRSNVILKQTKNTQAGRCT
jgi:IS30 family transposase